MEEDNKSQENANNSATIGGSRFMLTFIYPDNEGFVDYFPDQSIVKFKFEWLPRKKEIAGHSLNRTLLASIARKFAYYCGGDERNGRIKHIYGFTELKYGGDLYRCHPSYRQSGLQWNDSAYFKWNGDIESNLPTVNLEAQIHMFLDFTKVHYEDYMPILTQQHCKSMSIEKGYYCVIHSSDGKDYPSPIQRKLIRRLVMEDEMHVVNVDTIQCPAFLLHDTTKKYDEELYLPKEVLSVTVPSEWADIFLPEEIHN